jgi:hypothetical protein
VKNAFAPINRIPPEILSIIPDYWADGTSDADLITVTHVCRGWRELFISRPSLWACLECTNIDKTRTYIERLKTSPLKIHLDKQYTPLPNDALLLTVPHLGRLRTLTIYASPDNFTALADKYFHSPAPFLEKLQVHLTPDDSHPLGAVIFDGDLSSLRELRLSGVITSLPWKNLSNLTTFDFRRVPNDKISVTRLLDFFERAPLLSNIKLWDAFPSASNAPPGRVVPLPRLKNFVITAQPAHSILLKHLSIPIGTSLILEFDFESEKSPIPYYLPKTFKNLNNLSHITSVNLHCTSGVSLRLNGPRGELHVYGCRVGDTPFLPVVHRRVLRSLNHFGISVTERLVITEYGTPPPSTIEKSPVYQTLRLMNALRTIVLTDCLNLPFASALNPNKTPSGTVVCPDLEELVLYVKKKEWFCINALLGMVQKRASRGTKLSTITIISSQEFVPAEEVLKLRNHVSHVEYRLDNVVPRWDHIPDYVDETGFESSW